MSYRRCTASTGGEGLGSAQCVYGEGHHCDHRFPQTNEKFLNVSEPDVASLQQQLAARDAEIERLRKHVAHNDEEYATVKAVLRAEHAALQNFRALSVGVTGADASDTIGGIKVHYADGSTLYLADAFERAAGPDPVPYDLASLEEAAHRSRSDLLEAQTKLAVAREALAEACKLLAIDASYTDEPNVAIGLRLHAKDCAKFLADLRKRGGL